ncbi:MAG: rhomboid family intramembrane serine protease [Acetobacterales bacterium]
MEDRQERSEMLDEGQEGDLAVRRCRAVGAAARLARVPVSAGLTCRVADAAHGAELRVSPSDLGEAEAQLAAYEQENRGEDARLVDSRPPPFNLEAAMAWCTMLVIFFAIDRREAFGVEWSAAGAAQAGTIVAGEWWRTVTALTLHGGFEHLAGNVVFGMMFGMLLSQLLGTGVAWLVVVLAGVVGNGVNAALQDAAHTAVGASTAVFGGLGALSGYALRAGLRGWRPGLRRWSPVAAGVMLLAWVGFGGERTDIGAHVAGFVAGLCLGLGLTRVPPALLHAAAPQALCGAAAALMFGIAWTLALAGST